VDGIGLACCRLAGVSLVVPAVNYWWPLPDDVRRSAYGKLDARDRRTFWIAHHAPSLLCTWLTQTWFPTSPIVRGERGAFTAKDWEILTELWKRESGQLDRVRNSHAHFVASFFYLFFLQFYPY
jgi:hypothetical protein